MSRIFISAAHKSSGKTTISIGLCAALAQRGLQVQAFKKGPDYIDPMWLGAAAHRDCINLDFNTMGVNEMVNAYSYYSQNADIAIIEGNKGLYDGLDLHGSNSNAALAKHLEAPVVLVIDSQGMTRGIAPLILGYQAFEPNLNISGVILNKLGGKRHEQKLRDVIEHYTNIPVVGAVHRDPDLEIVERHLGLIPKNETQSAAQHIEHVARLVESQVDLEQILQIADACPDLPQTENSKFCELETHFKSSSHPIRIGIAKDKAFGFYYPDDLKMFEASGAELVEFDTLQDEQLPEVDGLFIGGGFPETQMAELEANTSLRSAIASATHYGMPVYAECGGLMYLSRSIAWQGKSHNMVGVIPADTVMCDRPQGRGYVHLCETEDFPWPAISGGSAAKSCSTKSHATQLWAHEFHYSRLENLDPELRFAYRVKRGTGVDGIHDGIIYKNILGSYAHLRDVREHNWVARFVAYVKAVRSQNLSNIAVR